MSQAASLRSGVTNVHAAAATAYSQTRAVRLPASFHIEAAATMAGPMTLRMSTFSRLMNGPSQGAVTARGTGRPARRRASRRVRTERAASALPTRRDPALGRHGQRDPCEHQEHRRGQAVDEDLIEEPAVVTIGLPRPRVGDVGHHHHHDGDAPQGVEG